MLADQPKLKFRGHYHEEYRQTHQNAPSFQLKDHDCQTELQRDAYSCSRCCSRLLNQNAVLLFIYSISKTKNERSLEEAVPLTRGRPEAGIIRFVRSNVGTPRVKCEVIQKKRAEKTEVREAARQAALKEIKERIKKTKDEKKAKKAEVLSKATKVGSRDARFCEMRRWEWWFRFIRACIANNKHLDQFFSHTARRHQRETIKRRSDEGKCNFPLSSPA
ncbi:hypothetical protein SELMODRAFT_424823 [Selaginella moellendorffii]|uniref:Uncharacterized protein n=1 Tax=Selaginella moellendorffii TaxID=88036 RepID=D8SR48_SELML|nr:hypothetical protein SELMODRAFT_424823 [Selaginella moellendorffii]